MLLSIFLLEAILISMSGVMAPGPLTAAVIGNGNQSPHAGAMIAIGHGIVELPLMAAVLVGVGHLLGDIRVKIGLGVLGGIFLLVMGAGMFKNMRRQEMTPTRVGRSALLTGILLTLGNPYFFAWWGTIGATLVFRSLAFGLWGFLAFAVVHWLCDFVWDYILSALSFKGGRVFGPGFQRAVFATSGALMLFFGGMLLVDAVRSLLS